MTSEQMVPEPKIEPERRPYALAAGEGEARSVLSELATFKATAAQTGGAFAVKESRDHRGGAAPLHVHEREDEACYVIEGELTFFVGDDVIPAPAGTWVYLPRHVPHSVHVDSDEARTLWFISPGGLESFFIDTFPAVAEDGSVAGAQPDVVQMAKAAAGHGVTILGPPPGPAAVPKGRAEA